MTTLKFVKKYIKTKKFIFSSLLILFLAFLANYMHNSYDFFNKSTIEAILIPFTGYQSMISLVAPIIVCIPFAAEYVDYHKNGFEKNLYIRQGKNNFYNNLFLTNSVLGFLTFGLSMTFFTILCLIIFNGEVDQSNLEILIDGIYAPLAKNSIMLYVVANILHVAFYGAAFSTLGLALSFYVKNKFFAWIGPFIITKILGLVLIKFDLTILDPSIIFKTNTIGHQTVLNVYSVYLILFVSSYILGKLKFNRDIENDKEF